MLSYHNYKGRSSRTNWSLVPLCCICRLENKHRQYKDHGCFKTVDTTAAAIYRTVHSQHQGRWCHCWVLNKSVIFFKLSNTITKPGSAKLSLSPPSGVPKTLWIVNQLVNTDVKNTWIANLSNMLITTGYTGLLVRTSTHCKCTGDLGFGRRRSKYINGEWWLNKSAILCTGSCHFHRWNPGWRSGIWIVRSVKHRAPSTLCTVFCITVISWLLQRSESTELLF